MTRIWPRTTTCFATGVWSEAGSEIVAESSDAPVTIAAARPPRYRTDDPVVGQRDAGVVSPGASVSK